MPRRFWGEDDLARLRELYPDHTTREVARELKRSVYGVYGMANILGLHKTPEYIKAHARLQKGSRVGIEHRYPKAHVPANKGLRRPGWSPGRMRETQFKKGERRGSAQHNWKPIGTILADSEGFLRIKVREAKAAEEPSGFGNTKVWPLLNRHVWEQHKGPIPPKHIVAFKDRNRSNCAIENLELLSMADNARRNNMWATMPRELAEVIQMQGALKRKLRKLNGEK